MNRLPESHHAQPPHGGYGDVWRAQHPHPPPPPLHYDHQEPRSAPTQPPPPPYFPVNPNRELPQPPPHADSPYGRPNGINGLSGLSHPGPEPSPIHTGYRPPLNGSPHEASPQSAPPDYRSRLSHPSTEPNIPSESSPPLSVPPHAPQYVSPSAHVPYPDYPGYSQNPAYGARQQQQRKPARATQACDQCRARKAKCDEGRPGCSHCKENNLTCVYKEVPPHKFDKGAQALLERIDKLQDSTQLHLDTQDRRAEVTSGRIESTLSLLGEDVKKRLEILDSNVAKLLLGMTGSMPRKGPSQILQEPPYVEAKPTIPLVVPPETSFDEKNVSFKSSTTAEIPAPADGARQEEGEEGEGELSIPVEHTTAAHKLLMWPSIQALLSPNKYDPDYVMIVEEKRGLISVQGQGENSYTADDTRLPSTVNSWDKPQVDSNGISVVQGESTDDVDAEIDQYGLLRLDKTTARRYYRSYMQHLHKLHPFLDPDVLPLQIEEFIRIYCPSDTPNICRDNPGAKRKRSYDDDLQGVRGAPLDPTAATSRPRVGKNIDNAVILLVFALGAICEHPSPLPGPIMDQPINYRTEEIPAPLPAPLSINGMLSPANSETAIQPNSYSFHPPIPTYSYPTPEYEPTVNLSRKNISTTKDSFGNVRNSQVIPGLALYGYATQILGPLQGGVELEHVHAGLLAGLYAGQLAHPFQSHAWISQAARACQVLIRLKRYERLPNGHVKDVYNFAYWTCLQLESDLLAELDIPASGISRSEGRMSLPRGKLDYPPDKISHEESMLMFFYSAQIHLRKVLNRVHTDLYKVEKNNQNRWCSSVQTTLSLNLDLWRDSLPQAMKWCDSEPPAKEINAARMRAKYYGARYIIHRPLLYFALHYGQEGAQVNGHQVGVNSPTASQKASSQQMSPPSTQPMQRIMSDRGGAPGPVSPSFPDGWVKPTVHFRDLTPQLRSACRICINCAISSTEAFDGIEGRLVVTNIFGTAHAQFGNMLVLSATYMSSLSDLVPRDTLHRLLKRTIDFLLRNVNISPTLRADARILTEIYEKIFRKPLVPNVPVSY
ncbi:hypothetical protein N7520_009094 [Penicillium odoratum]|uniref:uncharacterized protein n=1 Tax=Penicillium odoratum TaxID=1167516 RepID=UPI002547DB24|nr:uncharacterized protein N7520_009094 [Penicillium odoratum]KAJ5752177.1 hypothetical protein N7520_009094 [Penicillium odoratum]